MSATGMTSSIATVADIQASAACSSKLSSPLAFSSVLKLTRFTCIGPRSIADDVREPSDKALYPSLAQNDAGCADMGTSTVVLMDQVCFCVELLDFGRYAGSLAPRHTVTTVLSTVNDKINASS